MRVDVNKLFQQRMNEILLGELKYGFDSCVVIDLSASEVILIFEDLSIYMYIDGKKVHTKVLPDNMHDLLYNKVVGNA